MSEPNNDRPTSNTVQVTVIIASTLVSVAIIGAAVALALAGRDLGVIVGLLAPSGAAAIGIIAALGKLVTLERKTDDQTAKLEEVAHQTNGALRQHVSNAAAEAARDALREWFGDPKAVAAPANLAAKKPPRKRATTDGQPTTTTDTPTPPAPGRAPGTRPGRPRRTV